MKHFSKALKLTADIYLQTQIHLGMGNARGGEKHFETAFELAKVMKDTNMRAQALLGRGNALSAGGKNEGALKCYRDVLNLIPHGDIANKARAGEKRVTTFLNQKANASRRHPSYDRPMKPAAHRLSSTESRDRSDGGRDRLRHVDPRSERDRESHRNDSRGRVSDRHHSVALPSSRFF